MRLERDLRSAEDCLKRLKDLEEQGRIWGQDVILEVKDQKLVLRDVESKVPPGQGTPKPRYPLAVEPFGCVTPQSLVPLWPGYPLNPDIPRARHPKAQHSSARAPLESRYPLARATPESWDPLAMEALKFRSPLAQVSPNPSTPRTGYLL